MQDDMEVWRTWENLLRSALRELVNRAVARSEAQAGGEDPIVLAFGQVAIIFESVVRRMEMEGVPLGGARELLEALQPWQRRALSRRTPTDRTYVN